MSKIYVVGKYNAQTPHGPAWEIEGVFDTPEKAENACLTSDYFVGPMPINTAVGTDGEDWPGCYYPKADHA